MMLRRHIIRSLGAAVLTLIKLSVSAQQDPLFSQYMFNTLAFNPAYAGSSGLLPLF